MFWVITVYFNIRNILPKSGTFLLGHPVYYCMKLEKLTNRLVLLWKPAQMNCGLTLLQTANCGKPKRHELLCSGLLYRVVQRQYVRRVTTRTQHLQPQSVAMSPNDWPNDWTTKSEAN